jgi:hypothetical protein
MFNKNHIPLRLMVIECWKCHKLIGTRENHYMERHLVMRSNIEHYITVTVCEACHDLNK